MIATRCKYYHTSRCLLRHPQQISSKEVNFIQQYVSTNVLKHYSNASIYYDMKRKGKSSYTLATFYKLWHRLGYSVSKPIKKPKQKKGIQASTKLALIHIDVTKYRLRDNSIAYIYVAKDNFSRTILAMEAYTNLKAIYTENMLQTIINKYFAGKSLEVQIMTDGGPENKTLKNYIQRYELKNLKHIVAQVDVNYSNSMVEAAMKSIKYNGLYLQDICNFETLLTLLPLILERMNNTKMTVLKGMTPNECFEGKTYEDIYTNIHYEVTKTERLALNRNTTCCASMLK